MTEFLVRGAYVITMAGTPSWTARDSRTADGPQAGVLSDAAVHVRDGEIAAVDAYDVLLRSNPGADVLGDGTGIVIPGLVNAHTHLSEALATGMGSELELFRWGAEIVGPLGTILTREDAAEGTALRGIEMALSAVTTVNDMFVHTNRGALASLGVVDGLTRVGLRGVVSYGAEDVGAPGVDGVALPGVDDVMAEQFALAAATAGNPLVHFRYGIGTLLGQSDELLAAGVAACREQGWAVHTHLAEVRDEVTAAYTRWGRHPVGQAEVLGLLERELIAGHVIWVGDHELDALADAGAGVAHNPVANMILGSGIAPLERIRTAGIAAGIGTDGAASNDSQDMLQAVKAAALLQKVHHLDPAVIDAGAALAMATTGGARALGLDEVVGSLEAGKRADVVLLQDTVDVAVLHDPVSQVVYGASPRAVRDVLVDGRQIVADHRCVTVDERAQIERCRPLIARIGAESGLVAAGHARPIPAGCRGAAR